VLNFSYNSSMIAISSNDRIVDLQYHIRDLIQRVDKNGKSIGDIGRSIAEIWHAIDPGTDDIGGSSGY